MAGGRSGTILGYVDRLFGGGTVTGLAEGQLLERFVSGRDAAAFEAIVARHGPMVLGVCRRRLRDPRDAEDAFQATFLVLARRAGSIRERDALGPWLHGVADRVARRAGGRAARRRAREGLGVVEVAAAEEAAGREGLGAALDEEIGRLPERYRRPVVLCCVEGRSYEEAARQLGWTAGMVRGRLARGRERLRGRLIRRGIAPAVAALAGGEALGAAVPAALRGATLAAATAGAVPAASVVGLAVGVMRGLAMTRIKMALGLAAAGLVLTAGVGRYRLRAEPPDAAPGVKAEAAKAEATPVVARPAAKARSADEPRVETVAIEGRALGEGKEAVAGATVYVTDANRSRLGGAPELLGTATTDAGGAYRIEIALPVWLPPSSPIPAPEEGRFQVAGTAAGFGFAWDDVRSYRPGPRPEGERGRAFYRGEPARVDLAFGPPASLSGRVVDDLGRPLAGVKVQVGYCDDANGRRSGYSSARPAGADGVDEARWFRVVDVLPEAVRSARTDAEGRYRVEGLPREATLGLLIDPGPLYGPLVESVATSEKAVEGVRSVGYGGTWNATFEAPREVEVAATAAETGEPVGGVTVRSWGERMQRAGGVAETDGRGRATLRLRPGAYTLVAEPAPGMPYIKSEARITVGREAGRQGAAVAVRAGAVVGFEAVDEAGAGLAGAGFAYETGTTRERREVRSQTVFVDHPRTDASGRFRAVMEPGPRRFAVAKSPPGYEPIREAGELLGLEPGRPTAVRFAFRKSAEAAAGGARAAGVEVIPAALRDRWRRQRELIRLGRFRVRALRLDPDDVTRPDLEAALGAIDFARTPDVVAALRARFPTLRDHGAAHFEITQGEGVRLNRRWWGEVKGEPDRELDNGGETVWYCVANNQVDVGAPVHVPGTDDFCDWPVMPAGPGGGVDVGRAGGRIAIGREDEYGTSQLVADEATGFVRRHTHRAKPPYDPGSDRWQFGPKEYPGGAILPTVSLVIQWKDDHLGWMWVYTVEDVDLAYRPGPREFVVGVPAGTTILDYRGAERSPRQGTTYQDIADAITYAERFGPSRQRIEAVLEVGDEAPAIRAAAWLDREGAIEPPDLGEKVVLVDFWGTTCGPCVAQLPRVQEAAEHFAPRGLVLVGLHESGATVGDLSAFVRKRGLTYRVAIDEPAGEAGWFGATSRAYGVRAIPNAAVIDRKGRVAFVGGFEEALKEADRLLRGGLILTPTGR